MKKLFVIGILLSLLATNALALQEVAGTIIISTPIGGSNSSRYGLMNDGNETITISLRAEGDAAKYLSFPENVSLEPKKLVYTNITAVIPSDYDTSLGRNITGTLYALQEGTSGGQTKINIQLMKNVTIMVYGNGVNQTTNAVNQTTNVGQSPSETKVSSETSQSSPSTGLFASLLAYSPAIILAIAVLAVAYAYKNRIKNKVKKSKRRNVRKAKRRK